MTNNFTNINKTNLNLKNVTCNVGNPDPGLGPATKMLKFQNITTTGECENFTAWEEREHTLFLL
jgi:hypothetical protein